MMSMSVTLNHFDMINILCILFGYFIQHTDIVGEQGFKIFTQHVSESRMSDTRHMCAGSRCAASLLPRCRLSSSKVCRCERIVRQCKKEAGET